MQWRALPNNELSCLDVSTAPVDVTVRQSTCTIQPGECLTFLCGQPQSEKTRSDPLKATNWQLPLLAQRNPADSELRQKLTDLLTVAERSKPADAYDQQIRQLGPAAALPLLAFVRSPESGGQPELRHRAMQLAAELATRSCLTDLDALRHDDDADIRQMSKQAIARLQADWNSRQQ
jgi:hypothetical protein